MAPHLEAATAMDPKDIAELLPKETIDKLYTDALSPAAKEFGKFGEDAAKTLRLLTAPIQFLGALQDRLEPMLKRIGKRVPDRRRVEAPPEVVGPAFERMRYIPDNSELWTMYEEVLTRSVDSEEAHKVHPSFAYIISQLSADEARIVYLLRDRNFEVVDTLDLVSNRFENRVVEKSELPDAELHMPKQMDLYYAHLESLNIVTWPVHRQDPIMTGGRQTGIRRHSTMQLTAFGQLFAGACIPPDGFGAKK